MVHLYRSCGSIFQNHKKHDAMKIITKEDLINPEHIEILNTETHHNHDLVLDKTGIVRWKPDQGVCDKLNGINFNIIIEEFLYRGLDKNCEEYRKMYRDIGYSLDGYWEIFYWEVNNPIAGQYIPNQK
jgi:hypothetical protein